MFVPISGVGLARRLTVIAFIGLGLAACAHETSIKPSPAHITAPVRTLPSPPEPVVAAPYLPPPKKVENPLTHTVVVHEVPVKELLFALARDTKLNIDIHPAIEGRVTLNAVEETLPAILERLRRQVPLRYRIEGNTLSILPDTPYLRTYPVNYVNVARNTTSNIGVAAQIASTGATAGNGSTSGGGGNNSSTTVASSSNNNFWEVLEKNVRAILAAAKSVNQTAEDKAAQLEEKKAMQAEKLAQAEAVSRAGAAAPQLMSAAFDTSVRQLPEEQEVFANPVAGTLTVLATENQHQLVQEYLDSVITSAERQVLIEATIVEVTLKDQYRAGIDWQTFTNLAATPKTGLSVVTPTASTNVAGALSPFVQFVYGDVGKDFKATIDLLESFGNTRVLSSPKIMALNNQTALMKVVDNLVYFDVKADTTTSANVAAVTTVTTTPKTVSVGLIMAVTPQINENGQVSLTVRPTISRRLRDVEDPNPELAKQGVKNLVPVIQVREMESVLRIGSGQTVILGGLMQDDSTRARDGLPVLSRPEGIGALFGQHEKITNQTELVIFLRPTVVMNPSLDHDPLRQYRRYLPGGQTLGSIAP